MRQRRLLGLGRATILAVSVSVAFVVVADLLPLLFVGVLGDNGRQRVGVHGASSYSKCSRTMGSVSCQAQHRLTIRSHASASALSQIHS